MKKVQYKSLDIKKVISEGICSRVSILNDDSILKIFSLDILRIYNNFGINLEGKILFSEQIEGINEIVLPTAAVYQGENIVGYTMDYVYGINYNQWDRNLTDYQRTDLMMYAKMHQKIENVVKKANGKKIIMPDLGTCDNIIITPSGDIKIIDYDGLQIGKYPSIAMSTNLGNQRQYYNTKYTINNGLFNHNLDKKSLIILYFLITFNINLELVGSYNPYTKRNITLEDIFYTIGLDDYDVMDKVVRCYEKECPNVFLGEDVFRIAEKYNMTARSTGGPDKPYIKNLYRKR